uniref:Uncharacterized protein n=1 Tax=Sphaerodactylus townsendi TaxID=933632 RepID=A0ACB8E8C3_9SAUR
MFFPYTPAHSKGLGNQKVTANVMEVNASQTHRQTSAEASSLPPPPLVSINRPSLSPDNGTHVTSFTLPTRDDFWPSRCYRTLALSHFPYAYPFLAPDNIIHRTETASVMTDSAMSEYSSRTVSESSTAILDELQSCHYDTTDRSETPSPTLSQMSAVSDGTTLTTSATSSHAQITVNGTSSAAVSPMSHFQRPFSPSLAYSPPSSLSSSTVALQHSRTMASQPNIMEKSFRFANKSDLWQNFFPVTAVVIIYTLTMRKLPLPLFDYSNNFG